MKTRSLIVAGAAGICLATLGTALPAMAAPAAPQAPSSDAKPEATAPLEAGLTKLTSTQATIRVTGTIIGGDVVVTDGNGTTTTRHILLPGGVTNMLVPVTPGKTYDFTVTQTVSGQTSSPVSVRVDTHVDALETPTDITARTLGGRITVRLTAAPFIPVEVRNIFGAVLYTGMPDATGSLLIAGPGTSGLLDQHFFVQQVFSDTVVSKTVDVPVIIGGLVGHDVAEPTISTTENDGVTTIKVTRADDHYAGTLVIRAANFGTVAHVEFAGRTAVVALPTPKAAQLLRISVNESGDGPNRESKAEEVVLAEGTGSVKPDAPVVESATSAGTAAVASVKTAPGAVVSVKDDNGRVVAVRSAGSSSSVDVRLPGAAAGDDFTVTQSTGSLTSDPTSFEVK